MLLWCFSQTLLRCYACPKTCELLASCKGTAHCHIMANLEHPKPIGFANQSTQDSTGNSLLQPGYNKKGSVIKVSTWQEQRPHKSSYHKRYQKTLQALALDPMCPKSVIGKAINLRGSLQRRSQAASAGRSTTSRVPNIGNPGPEMADDSDDSDDSNDSDDSEDRKSVV